jgi:hypothetical protein
MDDLRLRTMTADGRLEQHGYMPPEELRRHSNSYNYCY